MTPMLFSVSYAGLWGQQRLDVIPFLEKAAALGYPAVELMGKRPHLSLLDRELESTLGEIRKTADRLGLQIATIAAYNDFTAGRHAAEVPFVEQQLLYVRELCRAARVLGASFVRVFSGYLTSHDEHQADWTKCVTALRESAGLAQDFGIRLGLQNHHDVGVSPAAYRELLDDVDHPNLAAMFDPWSVALVDEDLYRWARELAPRMVQTTLADYVRLDRFQYAPGLINYRPVEPAAIRAVPLGEGFLDLPAFFAGLRDGGFDGLAAYEMCSPVRGGGSEENLDRTARQSLAKIRSLIAVR